MIYILSRAFIHEPFCGTVVEELVPFEDILIDSLLGATKERILRQEDPIDGKLHVLLLLIVKLFD